MKYKVRSISVIMTFLIFWNVNLYAYVRHATTWTQVAFGYIESFSLAVLLSAAVAVCIIAMSTKK